MRNSTGTGSDYSNLRPLTTAGAQVERLARGGWRLQLPSGPAGRYRVAQLDDYAGRPRRGFPWRAPLRLACRMRASQEEIPGTWGVGLWNDPFSLALFSGAEALRLPALPQAAWFFFASEPNYLSLRDDLPAQGGLAGVFRSPGWPAALNLLGAPALPLLLLPALRRFARRLAGRVVQQAAATIPGDATAWRSFVIDWQVQQVCFWVDGILVLKSALTPLGPLGLVIWVDNQFLAFPPDGRLRAGSLACDKPVWIEIEDLNVV